MLVSSASVARAQFASVRGRVAEAGSGQPLPGVNVVLEDQEAGSRSGTATDDEGYFVIARLTPGRYVLSASFVGYQSYTDTLDVGFGDRKTVQIQLQVDEQEMEEVVVESERQDEDKQTFAGLETVVPSELDRVPTPGASPDLASYLHTLPGIVTVGDRGGQFFVRGGTPTQNLVLVDGMPIYQPFHIVGFYSAFPSDIMAYADVYAGGFSARYGGRLSSVIDVATRNGNKQRLSGGASVAPFLSAVRVEVPVTEEKVSLLASVRESVIERIAPDVLGEELPYRFGDRFVKLHAFLNQTSSLSLTALNTFDRGDVANTAGQLNEIRWRNEAYGGRYTYLPEDFAAMTQVSFFVSRLDSRYQPFGAPERTANVDAFGGDAKFIYFLGPTELHFALFARSRGFNYDIGGPQGAVEEFLTEGRVFFDAQIDFNPRLTLQPGLRMHAFPSRSQVSWEPRLRGTWRPEGRTSAHTFSAAWGIYHQQVMGLYNVRDVTDAFVTWAPSPEGRKVPRATHLLAGWSGQVTPWLTLTAEGYQKKFSNIAFAEFNSSLGTGLSVRSVHGRARGLDLKVEVTRPSFYSNVSYGLAKVYYEGDSSNDLPVGRFAPPHDRRHQVNALVRLMRGPYALNVRWQFGSGLPFTQTRGFYDAVRVERPDDSFRTHPGVTASIPGESYGARLPSYHRLDVSVERRFEIGRASATVLLSAINAYNRDNIFDFDVFTQSRVNQLPLIPSVGLNVELR